MNRSLTVALTFVVACSVLAPAAVSADASAEQQEITSCTVINESGEYVLTQDIQSNATDSCIEIQADGVTIDGNGHVLEGPGSDANGTGIDLGDDGGTQDVMIQNIEIAHWDAGIYAGGDYALKDAVVRDNSIGLEIRQGSVDSLSNVTIKNNDVGIYSTMSDVSGSDVTIQGNNEGIFGIDAGNYDLQSSEIVDNEEYGVKVRHSSTLNLTDTTVSDNGGPGIDIAPQGFEATATIKESTVTDNTGDGIYVRGDTDVQLTDVTVKNNDGLAVNGNPDAENPGTITASDLHVGPSATTDFEAESIQLESIDEEALPARDNGTAVGDGLNISGDVSGPIDLELDSDTDDETVDLWRHDGSEWKTIEEDLSTADDTVETSVDRNGLYVPGTEADSNDDDNDSDESNGSDDNDDESDNGDNDESDNGDDAPHDCDPSDKDGDKSDDSSENGDESSDDSSENGNDSSDNGDESSDNSSDTNETSTPSGELTESPNSDQQQDEDSETSDDEDDSSLADGPGFTIAAGLIALLAAVGLAVRKQ